jgi:hypothetical protein
MMTRVGGTVGEDVVFVGLLGVGVGTNLDVSRRMMERNGMYFLGGKIDEGEEYSNEKERDYNY